MSVVLRIKKILEMLPPGLGIIFNHVLPFNLRLGRKYSHFTSYIEKCQTFSDTEKRKFVSQEIEKIISHFISYGMSNERLTNVDTWTDIPTIKKEILRDIDIEHRSIKKLALKSFNTGGTSGNPLSFYVEKDFYAKEWAHMHYMWRRIGYDSKNTKITIRGKKIDGLYQYSFNQNEFLINSYKSFNKDDYDKLLRTFKKYNTKFIHGYPSAIYNFIKKIELEAPDLLRFLRKNIKGVMLGSEYPAPYYRDYIEEKLTDNTISWYGHTEGVILAGELYKKYEYVPFLSYGYAEAIKINGHYHLVGTSFHNLAAPFIRYNTEDLIEPFFSEDGFLEKFKIKEGRIGEFVRDRDGNKISLTALIFGRHHKLFNLVDFIQVKQTNVGSMIVYYTAEDKILNPEIYFDIDDINLDVDFEHINAPFKTPIGKIPLLLK